MPRSRDANKEFGTGAARAFVVGLEEIERHNREGSDDRVRGERPNVVVDEPQQDVRPIARRVERVAAHDRLDTERGDVSLEGVERDEVDMVFGESTHPAANNIRFTRQPLEDGGMSVVAARVGPGRESRGQMFQPILGETRSRAGALDSRLVHDISVRDGEHRPGRCGIPSPTGGSRVSTGIVHVVAVDDPRAADPASFERAGSDHLSDTARTHTELVGGLGDAQDCHFIMLPKEESICPPTDGRIRGVSSALISVDRQVMGGAPCIAGTRIPVATIVSMVAEGSSVSDVMADFPQLSAEAVSAALQFAVDASS